MSELLLGQRLGVGGSLQFLERAQLAVPQRRADEAGVLRVRSVVLDERGGEEAVERRLAGLERLPELRGQSREDVPLVGRQPHPVRAVPASIDSPSHG